MMDVYRVSRALARGAVAAAECYATAEILWLVLTPTGPRLYEMALDRCREYRDRRHYRAEYRAQVMSTLEMIRRLPEHGPK